MAPIMAFVLVMSIFSGRRVSATGTYRRFPIAGMTLMLIALYLFSHMNASTPYWQTVIPMAIMGTGLGMTMQVLLLVAQNSVEYAELGVATSLAAFGRSIGGAIGTAVFGTIFANRLAHEIPKQKAHLPAALRRNPLVQHALNHLNGASITGSPATLKKLPAPVLHLTRVGFSDSLHVVFLACLPVAALGVVGALLLKEVKLRGGYVPAEEGIVLDESLGMVQAEEVVQSAVPKQARPTKPASTAKKASAAKKTAPAKKAAPPRKATTAKKAAPPRKATTARKATAAQSVDTANKPAPAKRVNSSGTAAKKPAPAK
jgi:hypothetical protein